MKKQKTAIYCRLARKDFLRIREQKKALQQFAIAQGYNSFKFYIDNGVGGNTLDRPAFSKLTMAIQNGDIDTIIIQDISRIACNYLLVPSWIDEAEKAGVKLVIYKAVNQCKTDFANKK